MERKRRNEILEGKEPVFFQEGHKESTFSFVKRNVRLLLKRIEALEEIVFSDNFELTETKRDIIEPSYPKSNGKEPEKEYSDSKLLTNVDPTIFVSGLTNDISKRSIYTCFRKLGTKIKDIRLKGHFGFVEFEDAKSLELALRKRVIVINNKKLYLQKERFMASPFF